ncbi:MAG: hypothetical protein VB034_09500 [Eubacteriales bacterium]|nr:hypothetical protein [Petrimonas sp.]MEA5048828.1 hypothetical protein [Eubacteriales bacterium]
MKGLVLLTTLLLILGISNLCAIPNDLPTEAESAQHIYDVSMDTCDYDFYKADVGHIFRSGERREAFIGTYENGSSFDGEHAYQYVDGEKTQINEFPFDQYDSYAEKILELSKTILTHKYYTAYNDTRRGYEENYYYYKISKEGLALFQDQEYSYGRITCYYFDNEFQDFTLILSSSVTDRPEISCTFGKIRYTTTFSPVTATTHE